jgi:hypothetical protein
VATKWPDDFRGQPRQEIAGHRSRARAGKDGRGGGKGCLQRAAGSHVGPRQLELHARVPARACCTRRARSKTQGEEAAKHALDVEEPTSCAGGVCPTRLQLRAAARGAVRDSLQFRAAALGASKIVLQFRVAALGAVKDFLQFRAAAFGALRDFCSSARPRSGP